MQRSAVSSFGAMTSKSSVASVARLRQWHDIVRAWRLSRALLTHDRWSPDELAAHQAERLSALVSHAAARSRFYQDLYKGIRLDRPIALKSLPVITKAMVMDSFDRLVTDPRLRLSEVTRHVQQASGDALHLDEYRALSTSGTTGLKGIFVYTRHEWSVVLADTLRWQHVVGVRPRLPKRLRMATIGAGSPAHVSYRLTASGNVGLFNILMLDATAGLSALVHALNAFQPEVLLPYASVGALLAAEQLEGRLDIRPKIISTHSETLSLGMAALMEKAWGHAPFDHYGLSEHPNCACACPQHAGLHLFEDLFIAEIVDEGNRPVPAGAPGYKLLLTNLYNLTQPLIRYEVTDMLTIGEEMCPCGRPFRLVSRIGGRSDDIVYLRGAGGTRVPIHPLHFYDAIEAVEGIRQFRVLAGLDGVRVELVLRAGADHESLSKVLSARLGHSLSAAGAVAAKVEIEMVSEIKPSTAQMGKTKLIVAQAGPQRRFA
jgi:phenylacetate-coenzyme A ligase PaaK-like adenylate-forming protein